MDGSIGKSGNALGEIGGVLIFGEDLWYTLNAIVTHSLFCFILLGMNKGKVLCEQWAIRRDGRVVYGDCLENS